MYKTSDEISSNLQHIQQRIAKTRTDGKNNSSIICECIFVNVNRKFKKRQQIVRLTMMKNIEEKIKDYL